jgi:hypothetical protein
VDTPFIVQFAVKKLKYAAIDYSNPEPAPARDAPLGFNLFDFEPIAFPLQSGWPFGVSVAGMAFNQFVGHPYSSFVIKQNQLLKNPQR